jgi:anti-anti-sigma factor
VALDQDIDVEFELSRREDAGVIVVSARGAIDLNNASALEQVLQGALAAGKPVVVDTCGVEVIDSTGLRVLLDARSGLSRRGLGFALACDANGSVARLLSVAGAGRFLREFPSVAEAVAALRGER